MAERNIKLRSFKTTLPELHCDVYFVMARGNDLQKQVKNALKDFEKLGFAPQSEKQFKQEIQSVFQECFENPGFTFELDKYTVAIVLRPEYTELESLSYFISIVAHEIVHGIFFLFRDLQLNLEDDEHIAIVEGNLLQEFLEREKLLN